MNSISIIGTGNMARTIGALAVAGGNAVEVVGRDQSKAAPASASVVKAFNTVFGVVLAQGRPLDVFIAGDDARAKGGVSEFIESLKLRPLDVGGLNMAHWLEGTGLVVMGLARHGVGNFDFALGATVPG